MEQAGVVRDDDEEAGCFLESADDHGCTAFEDAVDAAAGAFRFGRATTAGGGSSSAINTGDNEVAMKCCAGVFSGDVKVGGSIGRNDEGKAFRVELDGASHEVGIAGGDVVGMSDAGDAALFFEGVESASNGSEGNAEAFGKSGGVERGCLFALEEGEESVGQAAGGGHRFQVIMIPRFDEYTIRSDGAGAPRKGGGVGRCDGGVASGSGEGGSRRELGGAVASRVEEVGRVSEDGGGDRGSGECGGEGGTNLGRGEGRGVSLCFGEGRVF